MARSNTVYLPCEAHAPSGEFDLLCADCRVGRVAYYHSTVTGKDGSVDDVFVISVPKTEKERET